jgi:hypothetical protein
VLVRGWTSSTGEFAGYVTSRLAGALAEALLADGVMGKSFGTARLVRFGSRFGSGAAAFDRHDGRLMRSMLLAPLL